ncbi:MAG TPA: hypothetical protein VIT44_08670 [Cyclobacteriaceae bacterium]
MSSSIDSESARVDRESEEANNQVKKIEEEGKKNILTYFNRIHDKLFTFNNIIIAGHFALSKVVSLISVYNILVPIVNLCVLIFIEYRMMEISRFEAEFSNKTPSQIRKQGKYSTATTLYSFLSIVTTLAVTAHFLYRLFSTK